MGNEIIVKKLFDKEGKETGCILSLPGLKINAELKQHVEQSLHRHAFKNIYPNTALNFYSQMYDDVASIVVIRNINNLEETVDGEVSNLQN